MILQRLAISIRKQELVHRRAPVIMLMRMHARTRRPKAPDFWS